MTSDDLKTVDQMLARLTLRDSEAGQSARVMARCHDVLARAAAPASTRKLPRTRMAESALVSAFCLAYLCAIVLDAVRWRGPF